MHETVIAQKIIDDASRHGKVKAIKVGVGEVAHITLEELEPTLKQMVDWTVELEGIPAVIHCQCGFEGHPKILERGHDFCVFECPECGGTPEIKSGGDIVLQSVEID